MTIESPYLLELLVPLCPGLRDQLVSSADCWLTESGKISTCSVFSLTSDLVTRRVSGGDFSGLEELFGGIERCLAEGSDEVATAVATCFLENLINRQDIGCLVVPFMGPLARRHCRAWDEFTGVTTPAL